MSIEKGMNVLYVVGRGWGRGVVTKVVDHMVRIKTDGGSIICRSSDNVQKAQK